MSTEENTKTGQYPIREVSKITGVQAVTLRAWERRFGLITPERTPKGHRLYSQDDIDLILQILSHLARGVTISRVRPLLRSPEISSSSTHWRQAAEALESASYAFNAESLHQHLQQLLATYPVKQLRARVFNDWLSQLEATTDSMGKEGELLESWLKHQLQQRFWIESRRHSKDSNRGQVMLFHPEAKPWWQTPLDQLELAELGLNSVVISHTALEVLPSALIKIRPERCV